MIITRYLLDPEVDKKLRKYTWFELAMQIKDVFPGESNLWFESSRGFQHLLDFSKP
jgi:hypothetical protein